MSEYKYKTLAELKAAYDSGELSKDNPVTLDNDSTSVYTEGDEENDIGGECVFSEHPADLMEQALDLLGIPWENA